MGCTFRSATLKFRASIGVPVAASARRLSVEGIPGVAGKFAADGVNGTALVAASAAA